MAEKYSAAPPPYSDPPQSSAHLQPSAYDGEKYLYDPQNPTASRPASPLPPATPRRGSQESSAAGSEYAADLKPLITTTGAIKSYNVMHTKSHFNIRVVDIATKETVFYVDNSAFTPGKPDVTLCRGSEKSDPVVGVVRWSHMYSKSLKIGVGDPSAAAFGEKDMVWEEVKSDSYRHPQFKWSISTSSAARKSFMWQRMHGAEAISTAGEGTNSLSFKNFKLVDVDNPQEVLAAFGSNTLKSWSKLGKIIVRTDGVQRGWGRDWEIMVLLSVLGLVEMSRRRSRQRRSTSGGGGGGGGGS